MLLAKATNPLLAQYLEFVPVQCRVLRSKCPDRITFTPAERANLVKVGKPSGSAAIKPLITIVNPRTFARWCSGETSSTKPAKTGSPRKPKDIRELIILMAKESGWGYTRIVGELKKLGIHNVSRMTVAKFLKENVFDTGPKRSEDTWSEFIKNHAKTLWACEFFSKKVWTTRGLVEFFFSSSSTSIAEKSTWPASRPRNCPRCWLNMRATGTESVRWFTKLGRNDSCCSREHKNQA